MSVEQFLAAVLPSQGYRFFLNTYGVQGTDDFRPVQRAYAPGQEHIAIQKAHYHAGKGANAYFATGGFLSPAYVTGPDGKAKLAPKMRVAERATHFRCLRLDIDCGPDKAARGEGYADKRTAFAALATFCNAYGVALPWVVDSGNGLHVYWALDRDVETAEWVQLAQRLSAACAACGLLVDTTTTLDAARVLRLPGTINQKQGQQRPVRIVHAAPEIHAPEQLVARFPAAAAMLGSVPAALRAPTNELTANLHQPYTLRGVLTQCPGMQAMLADGGARAREPLWKMTLDLVNKASDSAPARERVARALSQGHPSFDEGVFQRKWQQVQEQDYHPPTCSSLQGAGMPECAACPLRSRISSPLVLGRPQPPVAPGTFMPPPSPPAPAGSPPVLPPAQLAMAAAPSPAPQAFQTGIFRVLTGTRVEIVDGTLTPNLTISNGTPCQRIEIKDPADPNNNRVWTKPLIPYRVLEVERLLDEEGGRSMTAIVFDRGLDRNTRVELNAAQLTEARAFHTALTEKGLYVNRKDVTTLLETFMPEFLAQLQRARAANQIALRCGWSDDHRTFVLGTTRYAHGAHAEHVRPGHAPTEMAAYHAAGDEVRWRRAFDLVMAGGPDRQVVLALAFAAPLMAFSGLDGVMLNAYSPESGIGKSTLGDAALSLWGAPDRLRKSARDTANATWRIASIMGNMPMVIDEFTNVDGKSLSDFVYTLTQGREKHRLTSDARLSAGGEQRWCLAAIATANNSVHEKLQAYRQDAVAEAARVFDLRLQPLQLDQETLAANKLELQALRDNYGFMGPRLVELYLSRPADYWRQILAKKVSRWDQQIARDSGDRFRSVTAALVEVGAALGRALGFAFDVAAISEVVASEWKRQITEFDAERMKPADFITSYFGEYSGEFATIGGANGDALVTATPRRFRGEVRGKTVDGKWKPATVMIPQEMLRQYVRDKNGNWRALQEWMRKELGTGMVLRMGRLKFLDGQFQQYSTQAVEFSAVILGDAVRQLAPVAPSSVPSTPAKATV